MMRLVELTGGSHLYGLNTPTSDVDKRGLFLNDEVGQIIGLQRHDHDIRDGSGKDEAFYELRHFLCLLRKTNTQALEILGAVVHRATDYCDERVYRSIGLNYINLIDSEHFYKSVSGYLIHEEKKTFGERLGNGAIRKQCIEDYGYSPKNAVQYLRLCQYAMNFFSNLTLDPRLSQTNPKLAQELVWMKTNPAAYSAEQVRTMMLVYRNSLEAAQRPRTSFNLRLANEICLEFYIPLLTNQKKLVE